ncbi:HEPN domain-containing protein [Clavibacter zhangzhiyongii]|uniref:ApeA N-terminal domain 1-containing protein n=1 Tax=Clavibacter zhangzhiyongii TaxID=2768071 RepID=UPI0039DFD8BA
MLSENSEWAGKWWLPSQPDVKVSGVLTYDPHEGLRLRLVGGWEERILQTLGEGVTSFRGETRPFSTIHGIGNGQKMTLFDSHSIRSIRFDFFELEAGPAEQTIRSETLLVGAHVENQDAAVYVGASMSMENLTFWAFGSGIETSMGLTSERQPDGSGQIIINKTKPRVASLESSTIKLDMQYSLPFVENTRAKRVARVTEEAYIHFTSEDPQPLGFYSDLWAAHLDLISLCSLSACAPIRTTIYLPAETNQYPADHPLKNQRQKVEVYRLMTSVAEPELQSSDWRDFVLTLADVPFEDVVIRWHEMRTRFASAQAMILSLQHTRGGYIEPRVITSVGAAEALHRAMKPAPPMPKAEFKRVRALLLDAVPTDHEPWLRELLARNEPSLRTRLNELANRLGPLLPQLLPNSAAWVSAAVSARNKLAHDGRSNSYTLDELHALVEVTNAVVVLNFFIELEVPWARLEKALNEHRTLSFAAQLAEEVFPALPARLAESNNMDDSALSSSIIDEGMHHE